MKRLRSTALMAGLLLLLPLLLPFLFPRAPWNRISGQDDSGGGGDVFATNTVDTFSSMPDEEATPALEDNFDSSNWETDPNTPPSESDDPADFQPNSGGQTLNGGVSTGFFNNGATGAGGSSNSGNTVLQGRVTIYKTPSGNSYCCSGPNRDCFMAMNAIMPSCAPPGNERAASVVHQMRATLQAFRNSPDAAHLAAVHNSVQQWQGVPMTPKTGAYIDCYQQLLQASFSAEQMQQTAQTVANYAQIGDANARSQAQNALKQVQSTYQAQFDQQMAKGSGCTDAADGVPPTSTAPLRSQVAMSVAAGNGRAPETYRIRISSGGGAAARAQSGQPFKFALSHPKGSPFSFRSGTGRLVTAPDGSKFLMVTSLVRSNGTQVTPRGAPPLRIVPPAQNKNATPASRAAEIQAIRNARQSVLMGYARALNNALGSVPGLSNALQTGSAISQKMANDLKNSYSFTASPYAGVRLIRDALLGEAVGAAANAGARAIVSLSTQRLAGALAAGAASGAAKSEAATQLATQAAQIEIQEDTAVAQAVSKAVAQSDPALAASIAKAVARETVTDKRAVNGLVNEIVYNLETIARAGGNPAQTLNTELVRQGFTGTKLALTEQALLQNWKVARQLNAFTPDNMDRLRVGGSAILENGQRLTVDHTVPFQAAPEVANVLANLHYITGLQNSSIKNVITEATHVYAQQLQRAGLISAERVAELHRSIQFVRPGRLGK